MNSIPYFDARTLRANYLGALDTALEELSLSITEAQWLRRLATELTTPDSMRIEAQINAQPLASSCLLIHQSDPSLEAVYLYSPLHGVQGFNTLKQLESALQAELVHLKPTIRAANRHYCNPHKPCRERSPKRCRITGADTMTTAAPTAEMHWPLPWLIPTPLRCCAPQRTRPSVQPSWNGSVKC